MNITRTVLKRPVTTLMIVLSLLVFGLNSVFSSKLELIPEINMPMLIVFTVYPGASPDDVMELVSRPIEDSIGTLSGLENTQSISSENSSVLLLQYEYGIDIDDAYNDLKKILDALKTTFPDDVQEPIIIEMDINQTASMSLAVNNDTQSNLYNYVDNEIVPEFEKLSSVASVDISGGRAEYVRVELVPEKLAQYRLDINTIATVIASADFTFPVGDADVGRQNLSVTAEVPYDTMESLKNIPITAGNGNIIYLDDVANIYAALEDENGIGRFNGRETISINIQKNQSNSEVEVSDAVQEVVARLTAADPDLEMIVVSDNSVMIRNSLTSVLQTMAMAVVVSMVIILLFFGDLKASLIVGTSIPVSILVALIAMSLMGFSLNVVTLSSLVLGVGMMVDNSIVVMESCFRTTRGDSIRDYTRGALEGSGIVFQSIFGSTLTTCVVFLPLAVLKGMSGQLFKPLGFTIVFCMVASLISAVTIVPLCYVMYRPRERQKAPMSSVLRAMQGGYRRIMRVLLPHKWLVIFTSVAMLAGSIFLATQLRTELMPMADEGAVSISIETRPGLRVEAVNEILSQAEEIVANDENVSTYMLSYGASGLSSSLGSGSGASLTAYLRDDRTLSTDEMIRKWRPILSKIPDCNITLQPVSMMGSLMSETEGFEVILASTDYDTLKAVTDEMADDLTGRPEVTKVHSTLENAAPLVKVKLDPVQAAAEGLSPVQVAGMVNMMLQGVEATTLEVNGHEVSVMVEYPEGEYDTLDQMKSILIPTTSGAMVALTDIAEVEYQDSPQSITRYNKQYQATITADFTDYIDNSDERVRDATTEQLIREVIRPRMAREMSIVTNTVTETMYEELGSLFRAILIAAFLVFVVMAAQFESPKFSLMVMTTIPFGLIGSFLFLFVTDVTLSMPSMLGFMMLVGTAVNNGILYVDTVNQYRHGGMELNEALVEAGTTRLRPILMTTLTTVVAMIPMCLAYGDAGELLQGLALVDVGGLVASTLLALLMLPAYYSVMSKIKGLAMPEFDDDM